MRNLEAIAAAVDFDDPVQRMHRRLGHLSFQGMLNLRSVSTGMNIVDQQTMDKLKTVCPVCADWGISRVVTRMLYLNEGYGAETGCCSVVPQILA